MRSPTARACRRRGAGPIGDHRSGRSGVPFGGIAVAETGAEASLVYVPPAGILGAAIEAIEAGCRLVVATADEVPVQDAIDPSRGKGQWLRLRRADTPGNRRQAKMGFMPSFCYRPGEIGIISRSGSLSYEVSQRLTRAGIGQSTVIGIGGDPVKGTSAAEALALFHADGETRAILYLGAEIGGSEEAGIAAYCAQGDAKPVAAWIVGPAAPPGRTMGHAAALVRSRSTPREPICGSCARSAWPWPKDLAWGC